VIDRCLADAGHLQAMLSGGYARFYPACVRRMRLVRPRALPPCDVGAHLRTGHVDDREGCSLLLRPGNKACPLSDRPPLGWPQACEGREAFPAQLRGCPTGLRLYATSDDPAMYSFSRPLGWRDANETATISWTPRARSEVATVLASGPVLDTILAWATLARCTKAILSPVPSAFSQSASLAAGVPLVGCCAGLDAGGRAVSTTEAPLAAEVARGEVSVVSATKLPSSTDGLGSAAPGHLAGRHAAASAQRRRRQCESVGALRNGKRCAKRTPAEGGSPFSGASPQAAALGGLECKKQISVFRLGHDSLILSRLCIRCIPT